MKKILPFIAILIMLSSYTNAQESHIEKSYYSIQTGFLGVWVNNESKIGDKFALRSEIGFDSGIWGGSYYDKTGFIMTPVITVEPRLYYNLDKRKQQNKNIKRNAGNFLSVKTSYHPDWFTISNTNNLNVISDISIIPTWGIKRNIGFSNFNYEIGIGAGYQYIFSNSNRPAKSDIMYNLNLRIGYSF
ncbi:hypothetical protein SAMN05443634_102209 [Chishuiella changwenlii]|uniref:Outer membrane protein beta-barrel domain-containing protein n=1 Tax=Chishuiella changwenlii TaxID=1434701 RepID=A0A1M6U507_9FLAO|nr:hypothetical protein [Chishuiella changwenlii]GGE99963.1 hypothetical protein GCM10010984_16950 [Chishuiella changwenlii]SHK64178.1 hypothetical protein SAMN05443634_102209 [Chishuiella changwenlii]